MNIQGKFVTLRAMRRSDTQMIVDMFNDPQMENLVGGWTLPISPEQQDAWFERNIDDTKNLRFVIETEEDGAVGIATLSDIDWKNRTASHGMKLAKCETRAKGVGTDTVMAIMRYAFDELGLHRLDSSRFESNVASQKLYDKCGWVVEGVRRSCIYKRGQWRDLVLVGMLESDYRALIAKNHYWD